VGELAAYAKALWHCGVDSKILFLRKVDYLQKCVDNFFWGGYK
jgi:hypothetical protein